MPQYLISIEEIWLDWYVLITENEAYGTKNFFVKITPVVVPKQPNTDKCNLGFILMILKSNARASSTDNLK